MRVIYFRGNWNRSVKRKYILFKPRYEPRLNKTLIKHEENARGRYKSIGSINNVNVLVESIIQMQCYLGAIKRAPVCIERPSKHDSPLSGRQLRHAPSDSYIVILNAVWSTPPLPENALPFRSLTGCPAPTSALPFQRRNRIDSRFYFKRFSGTIRG